MIYSNYCDNDMYLCVDAMEQHHLDLVTDVMVLIIRSCL